MQGILVLATTICIPICALTATRAQMAQAQATSTPAALAPTAQAQTAQAQATSTPAALTPTGQAQTAQAQATSTPAALAPTGQAQTAQAQATSTPAALTPTGQAQTAQMPAAQTQTAQAPAVKLTAGFSPERLGAGTTVSLGFQIGAPAGQAPSPLTAVEVLYPAELGLGTSSLGLEACSQERLATEGLAGCPADSLMGRGRALVEVPFERGPVLEWARITLLAAPSQNGRPGLLFYVNGEAPVLAELIFPGLLLPAPAPFGGALDTELPLVPTVPGGPDASVIRMDTTLGPRNITYHERVHGRIVSFHPQGILLPRSCPRGGFVFVVHLTFQGAPDTGASTAVPCPTRSRPARASRPR